MRNFLMVNYALITGVEEDLDNGVEPIESGPAQVGVGPWALYQILQAYVRRWKKHNHKPIDVLYLGGFLACAQPTEFYQRALPTRRKATFFEWIEVLKKKRWLLQANYSGYQHPVYVLGQHYKDADGKVVEEWFAEEPPIPHLKLDLVKVRKVLKLNWTTKGTATDFIAVPMGTATTEKGTA